MEQALFRRYVDTGLVEERMMGERRAGARLAAVLWLVAAVLAWVAVGIRYYRRDEVSWAWAAAGLACVALGVNAWTRSRRDASLPEGRDRNPGA